MRRNLRDWTACFLMAPRAVIVGHHWGFTLTTTLDTVSKDPTVSEDSRSSSDRSSAPEEEISQKIESQK